MKKHAEPVSFQWYVIVLVFVSAVLAVLTLSGVIPLQAATPAASVNGEAISQQELMDTYNQLPDSYKQQFSEQQVLEQLIDKTLILQEAEKRGISVSQQDVDEFVDEQVATFGISRQQLTRTLQQANLTLEDYELAIREELVLREFIDSEILSGLPDVNETQRSSLGSVAVEELIASLRSDATIVYAQEYREN